GRGGGSSATCAASTESLLFNSSSLTTACVRGVESMLCVGEQDRSVCLQTDRSTRPTSSRVSTTLRAARLPALHHGVWPTERNVARKTASCVGRFDEQTDLSRVLRHTHRCLACACLRSRVIDLPKIHLRLHC